MGVNHYLGTFDSEWDAAAIYGEPISVLPFSDVALNSDSLCVFYLAWAHLILYGEEATKQAQKEGEEAAAAYEQEKKDIAAGKIIAPPPKPEKKKRKVVKKKGDPKDGAPDAASDSVAQPAKKKKASKDENPPEKKAKTAAKVDKESLVPILGKAVGKVRDASICHIVLSPSISRAQIVRFCRHLFWPLVQISKISVIWI